MKKIYLFIAVVAVIGLSSWGFKGHRAIATIAQKHLTTGAAYAIGSFLKGESMADVSTWADENRNPATASWHYINLPLGLTREQFALEVTKSENNIYTAILKTEASLNDFHLTLSQRAEMLKYLIHLVGDAHQPMHVSRKEDKGGNTIQLRFDGKGTNLHSLWDSKLIDREGLSEEDIAKTYDTATAQEIKQWQASKPMDWLWESYQISSELYKNVKTGQNIDEAYYNTHIGIIHKRIDQAGIRLAGELNRLISKPPVIRELSATNSMKVDSGKVVHHTVTNTAETVALEQVKNKIGYTVKTTGKVFSSKDIGSMILVNMGAAYPNQLLTLALKGDAKSIGTKLDGKIVTVTGQVIDYKSKPEIIVTDLTQLSYQN